MRKLYFLSTLVLTLIFCKNSYAQDFSNKGKEFWFCFPNHIPSGAAPGSMSLWITSDKATSGTVTMTNGTFSATFNIPANGIQAINIPHNLAHISNAESGLVIQKSIRVKADVGKPSFVAYAQQYGNARSAATLLLPTTVLGKKYRAISFTHTNTNGGGQNSRSQFQVIATKANTLVNVVPFANGVAGTPFTIPLPNIGDMYQYQATADITGTLIESVAGAGSSCSPIAVFSGNSAVTLGSTSPNCNGSSYDPLFQQNYPISTWGKNFGFIPLADYTNGNPYRVMASEDNTTVSFNGAVVATLNAGQIYPAAFNSNPVLLNTPTSITADKPICVTEYAQARDCSGTNNGDPDMVILNPIEQNIRDITIFSSTQQNINRQWLNVLIKTIAVPSFRIDGAVPSTPFLPAPNIPGYSYLVHQFTPAIQGSHILKADSGFNAVCYGFQQGQYESYAYSAGTNVKDLYQQIGVSTQYGIEATPSVCKGSPFKFKVSLPYCADSIKWDLSLVLPPQAPPPTQIYTACAGPGGADSTTVVNGVTLYWYSLPLTYNLTVSGTYPITITTYSPNLDGCGTEQDIDFELSVFDPPVANFIFSTSGCVAEAVQFNDATETPRPSYIWSWNFGDPASGAANTSSLQNPTHTFSAPGTYNVTFSTITTPGCISAEIVKQVTIKPLPTATIAGTTTVCINTAPPDITFTGTDGTAPYTFSYTIDNGGGPGPVQTVNSVGNIATVSAPTTVAGTFRYELVSVKNFGSTLCTQPQTGNAVVTVNPDATINLTSPAATANQAVCEDIAIANITYAVGGGGSGGTISGLPAGVTGVYSGGVVTISGTPTTPGVYNYTVNTTGVCIQAQATGTITVNPDAAIVLNAGPSTQTLCINTPVASVSYLISGGGTGGTVSGLPAGVTGSYSGGVFTILGTPTVSGTFNYTVTTTGTCVQKTATGTITVTANATLALTSAPATPVQTVCINHAITNVTYQWGGSATTATTTGLPAGLTATIAGNIVTISGTPTVAGVFPFTVQTAGPCVTPALSGSITITSESMLNLTSAAATENQELCVNSAITNITYATVGSATGITVTGLPAGVTSVFSGGTLTISGTPTVSGTFNYTVTPTGPCVETNTDAGVILVNPLPTANFNFIAPSCETRAISFGDLSSANVGTLSTWSWNFGDPASGVNNTSNLQTPSHTFATAGTYTVSLTVTNSKGCVSNPVHSTPVVIHARPLAGFILPEVCLSDTYAQFTDTSKVTTPDVVNAWQWNFGDPGSGAANTSTLQNPTHSYTAVGTYIVQLIATSNNGCKDTINQSLVVNGSFPTANFTLLNPASLCANDSVSIAEASTVFPGSITKVEIYWDNVGQPTVFDTDDFPVTGKVYKHKYANFQAPLTRTFQVRYRAYSGGVCVNDRLQNITVNAAPKVQFNPIPNACLDAAPFLITQASEIGGVPGPAGVFSGPGITAGGIFNPAAVGPGTYTLKYKFTSTAGGCSDSLTQTITVLDSASAQFTYSALNCENSPVSFNSTTSTIPAASGTITGWSWDFGDPASGAANTSALQNPTHVFSGWGNFTVTLSVTTSNGCRSTVRSAQVFVNPIPRPDFTFPASSCLPSATVAFNSSTSTIPDGTGASFTYLWDFGDPASGALNTSTNSSPSHIYNSAGPFTVKLQITSGAGCVNSKSIVVNTIHPQPTGSFTADKTDICVGAGTFTFVDNSDPKDGTTTQWNWNMDDGNIRTTSSVVNYNFSSPRTYNVSLYTVNSHGCRSTTFTLPVTVHPYPVVDAGPDRIMLEGGQITMDPTVTGNDLAYEWTPVLPGYFAGSNTIKNPAINGIDDITLTLTVTGRGGCVDDDQVFIKVLKFPSIPNIFSPNGDGVHDKWVIEYLNTYPGSTVDIYNRYGQPIFHSEGYNVPWDGTVNGKPVPVGTYYYIVNPKNGRKIMSGYVDVIR